MSELQEYESEFSRLLEGLPFDDAPRPDQAQRLREQVLTQFDRAAEPWWKLALKQGRDVMRRPVPRLIAAAACLAVLATWLFVPGQQTAAHGFHEFAKALVEAKTARFQMEVTIEGQPKQSFKAYYHTPGKFRQEVTTAHVINISDLSAGKIVSLMPEQKRAMVMNLKGDPEKIRAKGSENYFERLRQLLAGGASAADQQYQHLGEKEIDGKKVQGFRYDSPLATVTLWGDPKTGTPVRIENVWSGLPRTEVVMTHFEINVNLDESLFDLTVPAGYKVQSIDVDASPAREPDLIAALKLCADFGAGEFPETLDAAGINKVMMKHALSQAKDMTDETVQRLMKDAVIIGRGFQFALELPESADAHYAGKGVKRDANDRPVFWYKPAGAQAYHVINADLSVRENTAAPRVEGAVRIQKSGKSTTSPGK